MTDRDKLIELKRQAINYAQEKADERGGLVCIDDEVDYLLENGIVIPPCKVGDTVYTVGIFTGQLTEHTVTSIIYSGNNIFLCLECAMVVDVSQQIGKTVFFVKKEAEQMLQTINMFKDTLKSGVN